MGTEHDCPTATIQYRLNLTRALHSISPSLSALHTSRVAALHPEISAVLRSSHCLKCGTYRFSRDHPSYLDVPSTRKKRKRASSSHPKTFQRRCHLCGFSVDAHSSPSLDHSPLPNDVLRPGTIPPRTNATSQEPQPSGVSRPTVGTVQTTTCGPVPPLAGRQAHPKRGRTNASTLKDMLSRDRQREEEAMKSEKKRNEGREGLAAFLKEL